jgi:hypothetical protein
VRGVVARRQTQRVDWSVKHDGAGEAGTYRADDPSSAPAKLRAELQAALKAKFPGQVDATGSTAFRIHSSTARVEADVVPCFDYKYYFASGLHRSGTMIIKKDGTRLPNYPKQQIENGKR